MLKSGGLYHIITSTTLPKVGEEEVFYDIGEPNYYYWDSGYYRSISTSSPDLPDTIVDTAGKLTANSLAVVGGTSSQFMKADGSLDSTIYGSVSGTPTNNQIAVFTDADTIEGDSDLTWDSSTLKASQFEVPNNAYYRAVDGGATSRSVFGFSTSESALAFGSGGMSEPIKFFAGNGNTEAGIITNSTQNWGIGNITPATRLDVDGIITGRSSLSLLERGSAPSDTATYAQVWVKDDTPNTLWFTDDAGTDYHIGGTGAVKQSQSVTVQNPTSSEDRGIFFTEDAITVTKIVAVCQGTTPSVTWTIRHATDRSLTGNEVVTGGTVTTSTTTGSVVTTFNDATIPANSFVWLETTATSGTVNDFNTTIIYTRD